jgi:hypothetical protein
MKTRFRKITAAIAAAALMSAVGCSRAQSAAPSGGSTVVPPQEVERNAPEDAPQFVKEAEAAKEINQVSAPPDVPESAQKKDIVPQPSAVETKADEKADEKATLEDEFEEAFESLAQDARQWAQQ